MSENSFVLDPRAWINPPYHACPFCAVRDSYGVLMIAGRGYVRRCRECMKDETFPLPPAPKKLLYLDQFVISKLMFVLNSGAQRIATVINAVPRNLAVVVDQIAKQKGGGAEA